MFMLVVAAVAAVCAAPAGFPKGAGAHATYQSDAAPPARYRGDGAARIVTHADEREISAVCDGGPPTCGFVTEACTMADPAAPGRSVIHMPNPCEARFRGEAFARLECHERAHQAGWPAWHGD